MDYYIVMLIIKSCIYVKGNVDQCTVTLNIDVFDVIENDHATLSCTPNDSCSENFVSFRRQVNGSFETAVNIYKNNAIDTFTLSDGITYDSRVEGEWFKVYHLTIKAVVLEDGGMWECAIQDGGQTSNLEQLIVNSHKDNIVLNVTGPPYILLGSPFEYKCVCERVYPKPDVSWEINGEEYTNGTAHDTVDGVIWRIENIYQSTILARGPYDVKCVMRASWEEKLEAASVGTFVPTKLEGEYLPNRTYTPAHNFTMSCTVSGSSPFISWYHNGSKMDEKLFSISQELVVGDFEYGEKTALRGTTVWKLPKEDEWCSELLNYGGLFSCSGNSEKGPILHSKNASVMINYAPLLPKKEEYLESMEGETLALNCIVDCAMPSEVTFSWSSVNGRQDLEQNVQAINITVNKEDFNDTFICDVNNSIGTGSMTFNIRELIITSPTVSTPSPPTTSNNTNPEEPPTRSPSTDALILANQIIWSLCGIVAVVLIFLAVYHYRQIQRGKKNLNHSDEEPFVEDEAKPSTSRGAGEYDDINPVVSNGGTAGGILNEGLYAEVKNPARIPTATQCSSKAKAAQPQQGTPNTKRNQDPVEINSPGNTRRQEPNKYTPDRLPEPAADYSPGNKRKEMPQKNPNAVQIDTGAKIDQQRAKSPNQQAVVKPNANGTKPPVSAKPNITSFRSSRSSSGGMTSRDMNQGGPNYDNAGMNLYANCEQHPQPRIDDGTITYADLALQQEDPYDEGAPPVPVKQMDDQEPVQYASIKHNK